MMATIIYCFGKFRSSVRELEELCRFDFRVIYLMEQQEPSYATFCDFINTYIKPYSSEIFSKITQTIISEFDINIENQYIDGSKFQANANKYKFVWKPTTFHKRLDIKIKELLNGINCTYDENELITSEELNEILKDFSSNNNIDYYSIPCGKGKRLTYNEKILKNGYEYLSKLIEYEEKERICGEHRNSYYKTDKDATAMMLKEDYYSKTSYEFHPAYNNQILVSSGLILMYGVYQKRDDHHTLIPMLKKYNDFYKEYPKNLCSDSGYGIFVNYNFLKNNNIGNYLKFQSWNGESTGKKPQLFFIERLC